MSVIIPTVEPLLREYDAWFCDIWGVMHNGLEAFDEAVAACRAFQQRGGRDGSGGPVVLLTNAPRPAYSVAEQLAAFGVPGDCYDGIVSSGDVAQFLISKYAGKAIHHVGPARDMPIIETAGIEPVSFEAAEVLLVTGLLDDDTEGPEDYRDFLTEAAARQLPFICANPDAKVERGTRLVYCAGALAQLYETLGGPVDYAGKPYAPIYELAMQKVNELRAAARRAPVGRDEVMCIGDGLMTDMPGAFQNGFDAVFITSNLHVSADMDEAALMGLFEGEVFAGRLPRAVMRGLRP